MSNTILVHYYNWSSDPGIQETGSNPHSYSYYAPSTRIDSTVIRSANTDRGYIELPTTYTIDGGSFGFRTFLDLDYGNGVGTPIMGLMSGEPPGSGVSLHATSNPFIGVAVRADANSGPVTPRIYLFAIDSDGSVINSQDTDYHLIPTGGSGYAMTTTDLEFDLDVDGYLSVYIASVDKTLTLPSPLSYNATNCPTWTHYIFGPSSSNAGTGGGDEPGTFTTIRSYDLHLRSRSAWSHPVAANQSDDYGAVLHLPLDDIVAVEGARSLVGDKGSYSGSPTLRIAGPSDVIAYGVDFDGTQYALQTGALDAAGDVFSIECWLRTASVAEAAICGSTNDGTSNNLQLMINSGGANIVRLYLRDGAGTADIDANFNVGAALTDNTWHHLVAIYDGSDGDPILYFDGAEQSISASASNGTLGSMAPWDYSLAIAARNVRGVIEDMLDGELSAFTVYNRALSANDVNYRYQQGLDLWSTSKSPIVV